MKNRRRGSPVCVREAELSAVRSIVGRRWWSRSAAGLGGRGRSLGLVLDGLPDLILGFVRGFFEFVNGLGDTAREIGYALGTKENQNDQEDENEFTGTKSEDTGEGL